MTPPNPPRDTGEPSPTYAERMRSLEVFYSGSVQPMVRQSAAMDNAHEADALIAQQAAELESLRADVERLEATLAERTQAYLDRGDTIVRMDEEMRALRQRVEELTQAAEADRERQFRTGWAFGWAARDAGPHDRANRQRGDWESWIESEPPLVPTPPDDTASLAEQLDVPRDIQQVVNERFWEMVDDMASEEPAVGDVVELEGRRGWVRKVIDCHVVVELADGRRPMWQLDECTIIARRVDSLQAAMRLLRGDD